MEKSVHVFFALLITFSLQGAETKSKKALIKPEQIFEAVRIGNLERLRELIDLGANIELVDTMGRTPLYVTAQYGHADCLEELLFSVAQFTPTHNYFTPLHAAIHGRHRRCTELLINEGISVNSQDIHDRTPLHLAVANGDVSLVELLIKSGAFLDVIDTKKRSLVHYAAAKGHVEILRLLLRLGAPRLGTDSYGNTAHQLAVLNNQQATIQVLNEQAQEVFERNTLQRSKIAVNSFKRLLFIYRKSEGAKSPH